MALRKKATIHFVVCECFSVTNVRKVVLEQALEVSYWNDNKNVCTAKRDFKRGSFEKTVDICLTH